MRRNPDCLRPCLTFKDTAHTVSSAHCPHPIEVKGQAKRLLSGGIRQASPYKLTSIFAPDLGKVIMGYETWWCEIRGPEDARDISRNPPERLVCSRYERLGREGLRTRNGLRLLGVSAVLSLRSLLPWPQ